MKNMGLSDLRLVRPRGFHDGPARAMAVHADDVLDDMQRHGSLAEAVADCVWVVGTTCRPGSYRGGALTPREAAEKVLSVGGAQRVALVFGPEDHGLSNEDLKLCHELVTIPTSSSYPSLNLAQAVLVCAYELCVARHPARRPALELATADRLERMHDKLADALLRIGFLHGANPQHIMFTIRRIFGRARLDRREVAIWLGVARQIVWFADAGRVVAAEKKRKGLRLK